MQTLLLYIGSILTIVSVFPYVFDILKGKTKPRIVSWFVWTVLTTIAGFASLADNHIAGAVIAFSASVATGIVVVLGYKYSDKSFAALDIFSLCAASVGLILWWRLDAPVVAVVLSLVIDFIGAVPTIWHAWQKPKEETAVTFMVSGAGSVCVLFAITGFSVSSALIPAYFVFMNFMIAIIIVTRRRNHG